MRKKHQRDYNGSRWRCGCGSCQNGKRHKDTKRLQQYQLPHEQPTKQPFPKKEYTR